MLKNRFLQYENISMDMEKRRMRPDYVATTEKGVIFVSKVQKGTVLSVYIMRLIYRREA